VNFAISPMDKDRAKLQVAAVVGAVLGIVTGYVLGKPLLAIIIWALIGAVVLGAAVYCYRAFR
jgi:F0F1-type ATP synthase assembly protein I